MANEDKKDFNAMLHDSKDMPKVQTITDQKSIEKYGGSRMYFAPPIDYDKVMKQIPANRNKWLKPHIPSNNLYDVLRLKTVEECHANLPSKMILARYFYAITKMCVSSITG